LQIVYSVYRYVKKIMKVGWH